MKAGTLTATLCNAMRRVDRITVDRTARGGMQTPVPVR